MAAAPPPRLERTRSEASLGSPRSGSPHATKTPTPDATNGAAGERIVIPFDQPEQQAERWWHRRLPRLVIAPIAGRARQQRLRVGRLSLDFLAASRLPSVDLGGTSDPYVVATLSGTSLGKVKKEWPPELRSHYTTRHVARNLNPHWTNEAVDFDVWRYGAQLKIEVFDFDAFQQDELLCTGEVDVDDLAGAGPVEAWFSLKPKGGVRLRLRYDVDPLAEASSVLWLDAKIKTPPPKFDVNAVYGHALNFAKVSTPPANLAKAIQDALTWSKKEACFNLANPFYAGALAHVIEEWLKREELRISLAEQVSPSGRVSGTPSKAVAGAVKETSSGTFAKGAKTAIRQATLSELPTGDKY